MASRWMVLGLILALAGGAGAEAPLSLEGGKLVMPAAVRQALDRAVPGFRPYAAADYLQEIRERYEFTSRQAPFAVIGDLNGDRRDDLVVDGRDARRSLLLAVLSGPKGYAVKTVETGPLRDPARETYEVGPGQKQKGLFVFLRRVPAGTVESGYEDEPLKLDHDAFERVYYLKAAVLLYYADGRFQEYVVGD